MGTGTGRSPVTPARAWEGYLAERGYLDEELEPDYPGNTGVRAAAAGIRLGRPLSTRTSRITRVSG